MNLLKDNEVVNCKTGAECMRVLSVLWPVDYELIHHMHTGFKPYAEDYYISPERLYGSRQFYSAQGKTIIPASEFLSRVKEPKPKFTIQDLRDGKCAVLNDVALDQLQRVLKEAFPNDNTVATGVGVAYHRSGAYDYWKAVSNVDHMKSLPAQSAKDFLIETREKEESFEWGEEVEVSNNAIIWRKAVYLCSHPKPVDRHVHFAITNQANRFIYCRKPQPTKTFTISEATEELQKHFDGVKIEIVDESIPAKS